LVELAWDKPVLTVYHENNEHPEREAFAIIKAKKLVLNQLERGGFSGNVEGFFCLMGDADELKSNQKYIVCWFDDKVDDFYEGFRRLSGVTFPSGVNYSLDKRNKRTYNAEFQAKYAKLK